MPITTRLFAALLFALLTVPAAAQTDDSWLNELPSVSEVEAAIQYDDEVDTIARRQVMFETIGWAMENHMGRRYYTGQMTERERRTLVAYGDAESDADTEYLERHADSHAEAFDRLASARMRARRDKEWMLTTFAELAPGLAARQSAALEAHLNEIIPWYDNLVTGDTLNVTIVGAFGLAGLSFLILLVGSLRDRWRREGVVVEKAHDHMLIKYWPGKFSPITALSTYPLMLNIALFSVTIGVPLMIVLAFSPGLFEWLDNNVPWPDFMNVIFHREFWIWLGLAIVLCPWWIAAFANLRRRRPGTIRVDANGITVGNKTFSGDGIENVYGFGLDDSEGPGRGNYYMPVGNAAARAAEAGRMHREAIAEAHDLVKRKVGKVRYKVCIEHGGKERVLASKLSKPRAKLVLMAVLHAGEVYYGWDLDFEGGGTVSTAAVD